jgi:hypothetical protein
MINADAPTGAESLNIAQFRPVIQVKCIKAQPFPSVSLHPDALVAHLQIPAVDLIDQPPASVLSQFTGGLVDQWLDPAKLKAIGRPFSFCQGRVRHEEVSIRQEFSIERSMEATNPPADDPAQVEAANCDDRLAVWEFPKLEFQFVLLRTGRSIVENPQKLADRLILDRAPGIADGVGRQNQREVAVGGKKNRSWRNVIHVPVVAREKRLTAQVAEREPLYRAQRLLRFELDRHPVAECIR